MTDFLLFTLYAPLASWGEIAVGEVRGSWDRPSRSAVLGLVAAALGISRDDQAAHDALDAGYGIAVRLDAPGSAMSDYHTAQTVSASAVKKRRPVTRAELLSAGEAETILSFRGYRQNALATVVVWAMPGARWPLAALAEALREPRYVLYAGRKANAFGLPLAPTLAAGDTLAEVLAARQPVLPTQVAEAIRPRGGWGREVAHDPCDTFPSGLRALRQVTRRDAGAQRARWQFRERTMEIGELVPAGAANASAEEPHE